MTTSQAPLLVGVLLDSYKQPAWVAKLISDLVSGKETRLALVVMNDCEVRSEQLSFVRRVARWWQNRSALPYVAYRRLDQKRYQRSGDPEELTDIGEILADTPVIRVTPRRTKHCDYFSDDEVAAIRTYDLDVAVRFGFRILKGDALRLARYGVWSFHHGDNRHNRGGPAGFWEVMNQEPVTGAVLQVLSEELDAGLVIGRSFSSTDPISVTANKRNYYWQATHLLGSSLRRLYERREAFLDDVRSSGTWEAYSNPLFVQPRAMKMSRLAAGLLTRLIGRKLRALFQRDQWFLAYRLSKGPDVSAGVPDGTIYRFKELVPPSDRFWADPMPVFHEGKHYVFFEEYQFGAPKAHISVFELNSQGVPENMRVVLERPYHLSYPFVFKWRECWYMIPETSRARRVELYRSTGFPDSWELERVLLDDIAATDATVVEIDNRWWMFVGVSANDKEAGLLNLYHAPTPLGPWEPHRWNPVKTDVRSARPAGPLFFRNGAWYRPSQSGVPGYGSAIVVNRIEELSDSSFREIEVTRIAPTWRAGLNGTHTLAASNGLTVIDARHVIKTF